MIEIHGAGFRNKGAQMMIRTVLDRLPGTDFCIKSGLDRTREARMDYGLATLFPMAPEGSSRKFSRAFRLSCLAGRLLPKAWCARRGLVRRQDTDSLIDISGYGFGDAWHWQRLASFAMRAEQYHQRGKPVLLLPQMLGPFEKPESSREFQRIYARSSLIYARDRVSLEYARGCVGDESRLRLAPDITIFTSSGPLAQIPKFTRPYACLVPNKQLLQKSVDREIWRESYVRRLTVAGRRIAEDGFHVVVLLHDMAEKDRELAEQLLSALGPERSSIFCEPDPLVIKAFIARAAFIVSSRFHSLVAALSSGVPVGVIGWGHKYEMLLEEFCLPGMIHRATDPEEQLLGLVDQLLDENQRAEWSRGLREAKAAMRPANEAMWREVEAILGWS